MNVRWWQEWHERSGEKLAKLAKETAEKLAAAEAATIEPLKKLLQSSAEMSSRWLEDAKVAEAKARADVEKYTELARQYEVRTAQIDRIAPTLEQLFID